MAEPVYLYSYGRRRHIKDPNGEPGRQPELSAVAYCGDWHDTEARMEDTYRRWSTSPNRAIARKKAEPVCKRCLAAYKKAEEP